MRDSEKVMVDVKKKRRTANDNCSNNKTKRSGEEEKMNIFIHNYDELDN